jgi:hypothetical protein
LSEVAAHDFPPVVALSGIHVDEMDSDSSLAVVADDGAHLQFAAGLAFVNSKVNFDFGAHGVSFSVKMLTPMGLKSARKPGLSSPARPNRTRQSAARLGLLL